MTYDFLYVMIVLRTQIFPVREAIFTAFAILTALTL